MIRRNNPFIDFDQLEGSIRTHAEQLRVQGYASPDEVLAQYRAAEAYLDRAEELNQPRSRIPRRFAPLLRFGSMGQLFLKAYNLALLPTRRSNALQIEALRELLGAGLTLTKRIEDLEREIERLRNKGE
ncbi:MAG TPA: hypothetical protein VGG22_06285 [Candidatus Baltobacteraceae bacterium]|jgi:hypothetical protein